MTPVTDVPVPWAGIAGPVEETPGRARSPIAPAVDYPRPFDHTSRLVTEDGSPRSAPAAAGAATMALLVMSSPKAPTGQAALLPQPPADFGGIDAFGRILFSQGLVPFELSSALLMVAIVGAVAVARGRSKHDVSLPAEKEAES